MLRLENYNWSDCFTFQFKPNSLQQLFHKDRKHQYAAETGTVVLTSWVLEFWMSCCLIEFDKDLLRVARGDSYHQLKRPNSWAQSLRVNSLVRLYYEWFKNTPELLGQNYVNTEENAASPILNKPNVSIALTLYCAQVSLEKSSGYLSMGWVYLCLSPFSRWQI